MADDLAGAKILVTGAGGFLGPWLCEKLLDQKADVIGIDINFEDSSRIHEIADRMRLSQLNIEDFDSVEELLVGERIQFVFHLAAQALVGVALEQPLSTIATNVMGTANILEVARRMMNGPEALKGILVASSDKAYGDQEELPYLENAPMLGRFPYDVSKSCADLITRSYFYSYALPVCVTRCGNLYGGGDLNWSRIVPGTIRSIIRNERPIIRSDGTLVRDYIYVEDAAEAVLLVGKTMIDESRSPKKNGTIYGEAFNISNDHPYTVIEIVDAIRKVMGREDLAPLIENTARGEIKAQYLSSKRIRERLKWAPKVDLIQGLSKTVEWYCEVSSL